MNTKLDRFWEWLQLSGGEFKGQPIPNYVFIFVLIIYFIQIIMMITNKIKEYLMNLENIDAPYDETSFLSTDLNSEMELPYGDFVNKDTMICNQMKVVTGTRVNKMREAQ